MAKISVAVATFNEEENIDQCLGSVSGLADEIVVVDGGSADKTVDIAKKYQARIVKTDNPPIFHINKQKAIDTCSGKWILQLDADEVMTEKLRDEIKKIVNKQQTTDNKQQTNGYWIPRKNFFLGRFLEKGGQYPDYTLRLYKKGKGKLPCKSVHEQAKVEGRVGYLKNPLLHHPYPDFTHYLDHFNRYTSILSQELKNKNVPLNLPNLLSYMFIRPFFWFLKTYLRHRGYVDGFAGFVFSLFSSLRFPVAYIKYWESKKVKTKN